MPGFHHTLIGVGPLCDSNCTVTFRREAVIVRDNQGTPVLIGWRDASGPRLWIIALQPGEANLPRMPHTANLATLAAHSAYDLPSVAALIRYFHAAAGYPVRSIWLKAISAGNYSWWPGLTLSNATNYCPSATATIVGYIVQKIQGVRSTRPKLPPQQVHLINNAPRSAQMSYIYKLHPSVSYILMTQVSFLFIPAVEINTL